MRAVNLFFGLARNRDGAVAIEFGMLLTIFLMAVFGDIELGRYAGTYQALSEAVHIGARYAVVHGSQSSSPATTGSLQTLVQNSGGGVLTPGSVSVTVTFSPNNSPGSTVTLVATYPWSSVVPLLNLSSATIQAKSVATILN